MMDLGGLRHAGAEQGGDGGVSDGSECFSFASSSTRWYALDSAVDLGEVLGVYSPYVLVVESRVYDLHASLFLALEGKGIWVIKVLSGEEKKCFFGDRGGYFVMGSSSHSPRVSYGDYGRRESFGCDGFCVFYLS